MKAFFKFYCSCDIIGRLKIFKSFFDMPAFFYHELCHVIVLFLFFNRINKVNLKYFYKVSDYGTCLNTYNLEIGFPSRNNFNIIAVSIAPLIGIFISPFISWYFFAYLIITHNVSVMSTQDYYNIRMCSIRNKKLSFVLNKVEKIISHN